jgi:hypothetical protein
MSATALGCLQVLLVQAGVTQVFVGLRAGQRVQELG